MARIRSIHPSLFTDEAWVSCSPLARVLYIGLMTDADDQGLFEWKPLQIKMRLLPADAADIPALLEELVGANLIAELTSAGKRLGAIRKFRAFQRPKKPHSAFTLPTEWTNYVGLSAHAHEPSVDEDGEVPHRFHTGSEPSEQKKEEGGRMGREGGELASASLRDERVETDWPDGGVAVWLGKLTLEAGPGLADPAKEPGLLTTAGELERWRRGGCSWLLDVVPTTRAKTAKPRASPIRTWSLITPDIVAARDRRLSPLAAPSEDRTHVGPTRSSLHARLDRAFAGSAGLAAESG